MGKRKIEYLNNVVWITDQLEKFERVNYEELKKLTHGTVANLAPVTVITKGKKEILDVRVADWYSLTTHYHMGLRQRSVFAFIWETLSIAIDCERAGLRIEKLSWNWDLIFVDNRTRHIKMLYWPVIDLKPAGNDVLEFYRGFIQVMSDIGMDKKIIKAYANYFLHREIFDMHLFRQTVQQIMEQWKLQRHERKKQVQDQQESVDFFNHGEVGTHGGQCWVELPDGSGKCSIDSDVLAFGRDNTHGGVCIKDDPGVSRQHARIIRKAHESYLEDLGSVNGTYHNGRKLSAGEKSLLQNGDTIRMSKTTYIFQCNEGTRTLHIHDLQRSKL